jgi:hypothetical protein
LQGQRESLFGYRLYDVVRRPGIDDLAIERDVVDRPDTDDPRFLGQCCRQGHDGGKGRGRVGEVDDQNTRRRCLGKVLDHLCRGAVANHRVVELLFQNVADDTVGLVIANEGDTLDGALVLVVRFHKIFDCAHD